MTRDANDAQVASNGANSISALDPDARVFRRRAVKRAGTDQAHNVEWAVVELAGVRVYFDGTHVVVTRQDLNP